MPRRARLLAPVLAAMALACPGWRERPPATPAEPVVDFPRARTIGAGPVPVVRIDARVGTAAIGVSLQLGSASDPPASPGLTAALLALLRGHGEHPDGLAAALGEFGGVPELHVGLDGAVLSVEVPSEHAPAALAALLTAVARPRAGVDEHAALTVQATAARARARDDPTALAIAGLYHAAYPPGHPYRRTELSAGTWSIEHVLEAHRRQVGPGVLAIVVAGEVDDGAVVRVVDAALAGWRAPATPAPVPAAVPAMPRALHLIARPGLAQAVIAVGAPLADADEHAARVAVLIVQSALHARLREEMAATYGVEAGLAVARGPGLLHARTEVDAASATAALTAMRGMLETLRRGPLAPTMVARVCRLERLGLMLERQTNESLLLAAARLHWQGRPVDADARRLTRDCDTLAPAVQDVLRAGLDPAHLQVVVVADPARVEAALAGQGLGPPVRLDPADL